MKKYGFLIVAVCVALGLSACGDNKTKQKVVNGSVYSDASVPSGANPAANVPATATAKTSAASAKGAVTAVSSIMSSLVSHAAPGYKAYSPAFGGVNLQATESAYTADADGWFKYEYNWNYSGIVSYYLMKYRLLDVNGTAITGTTESNLWETGKSKIKSYEYKYSGYYDLTNYVPSTSTYQYEYSRSNSENSEFDTKKYSYDSYIKYVYTDPTDFSAGGVTNGYYNYSMTYKDGSVQEMGTQINNLTVSTTKSGYYYNYKYTAGNIKCTWFSWTFYMEYNSDGSASGYIDGPGYHATVAVTANGSYSYTDSEGTHTF